MLVCCKVESLALLRRTSVEIILQLHSKRKVEEACLYSAYYELLSSRRSGMACVNEGSHSFMVPATHTFMHKGNEPYLTLALSRRASPPCGWCSFLFPLRVGG